MIAAYDSDFWAAEQAPSSHVSDGNIEPVVGTSRELLETNGLDKVQSSRTYSIRDVC